MNSNLDKEAIYIDKYNEERRLRKTRHGWQIKREGKSACDILTPVIASVFGENVRAMRIKKSLTAEQLAIKCGFTGNKPKGRIYEIEKSHRPHGVRMSTLYVLATALDCEVSDLLPSVGEMKSLSNLSVGVEEVVRYG